LNNAETVANAVQSFFQPVAIRDAFDFESKLFYDEYFLVLNQN
jgi:hypothetical protein